MPRNSKRLTEKAIHFLLIKIPHINSCCCCLNLRLGATLLAATGIIIDIHIFNANISLTMICWFGLKILDPENYCQQIWFLTIGGFIAFLNGIVYFGITLPALVCDILHLVGIIIKIPDYVILSLYIPLPLFLVRLIYLIGAVATGWYTVFVLQFIGTVLGLYWWLCVLSIQGEIIQRGSETEGIIL